ncbi:MAG TPA: IS481 family transposase [Burkholderiaceae bacterium]|nr:IS481 family transposase [Burkholderiaceae bacterium]
MPWHEVDTMTLRQEFTSLARQGQVPLAELCRRYGISRKTGYKWLGRAGAGGEAALQDRSRRPHVSPGRVSAKVEEQVVALRQAFPAWGPRKLRRLLQCEAVPAVSTVAAILRRHGLIRADDAQEHRPYTRFEHAQPNDLWQMDFKGHFAIESGRCHSLTVLDDHSRFSVVLAACGDETTGTVKQHLVEAFRRYGLPWRMTMDNGAPWGNDERHGYTPLTVWLMRLGVAVSHSRPYHPQTQGKDERFHRTLKAEVLLGRRFNDLAHVQQHYDAWRHVYNAVRPHEALDLQVPQQRYRPSARSYPEQLPPLEYGPGDEVRKVQDGGQLCFRGSNYWVPKALRGQPVALRATGCHGTFEVYFGRHRITEIDLRDRYGAQSNV